MNGLRGLAAWAVFNLHYLYAFTYKILIGYGTYPKEPNYFYQLPGFPLLYDGTIAVQVFFGIAGYICSYKALQYMTNKNYESLFNTLPSSIFRRFFRLYLPAILVMFIISILAYCGMYETTRVRFFDEKVRKKYFPGPMGEQQAKRFPTLMGQLSEWWKQVHTMGNPWIEWHEDPPLDVHLWTIFYEFRSSMQLFIALVALAKCRPWVRIFWLGFIGYLHAFQWRHFECLPFFYGAIIAQIDILDRKEDLQVSRTNIMLPPRIYWLLRTFLYVLSIYAMSYPIKGWHHHAPMYEWMLAWIPDSYGRPNGFRLPKQIGSLTLICLLNTIPIEARGRSVWHRMLTSNIATYLGSIMFGFYLLHGTVLHLFGYIIPHIVWNRIGGNGDNLRYLFGLGVGYMVSLVAALWAADVWTREVESRIVKLTAWLEKFCFEHD